MNYVENDFMTPWKERQKKEELRHEICCLLRCLLCWNQQHMTWKWRQTVGSVGAPRSDTLPPSGKTINVIHKKTPQNEYDTLDHSTLGLHSNTTSRG